MSKIFKLNEAKNAFLQAFRNRSSDFEHVSIPENLTKYFSLLEEAIKYSNSNLNDKKVEELTGRRAFTTEQSIAKSVLERDNVYTSDFESCYRVLDAVTKNLEKQKNNLNNSLVEKLMYNGINEAHAIFISDSLNDIVSGENTGVNSKNNVYFLKNKNNKQLVIKFVDNKDEAELENKVNKYFSQHVILKKYVPGSDMDEPIEFELNGKKKYALIQNDIRSFIHPYFEQEKLNLNHINYWIKALAEIHHYGSEIMNELNIKKPAETLSCMPKREKDLERLERLKKVDINQINDLVDEAIDFEKSFIHFDSKPENRIGQYFIDWGNSGWGSPYLDVSMILNDHRLVLNDDQKKHFVKMYINERNILNKKTENKKFVDEKKGLYEFGIMQFLINSTFNAYYNSRESNLTSSENERYKLIKNNLHIILN